MSQRTRESVQDQAGFCIDIFRKKIDFLKSENNSYLLTTSSTQILHLVLAICCNHKKSIVNCTKSKKQGNQSKNRLLFASISAQKNPPNKSKNLGEKKSYFLKNSSTKILIFYLRICCKSSTLLNANCKTQRNTVCTRATAHATLLSSSSFPVSVSERVKSTVVVCFWGSNRTLQNFLPAIRFSRDQLKTPSLRFPIIIQSHDRRLSLIHDIQMGIFSETG